MAKINVLDSSIYNLISAGEVVERPSSVVKELVENSIDAGAKHISVEIYKGGKSRIKVTDDGTGIEGEDLEKAFLPHATSKISAKDDLFSISTLGFRGEALASIAAVSMVSATSKTAANDAACCVKLTGGKITERFETSGVTGTSVCVENLFYATPARLKFLKKDKSEESEITSLMSSLILANPYVAFTYSADGKKIYQTQGTGLKDAVLCVYDREITMNFVEIENTFKGFSISGYISAPTYFKGNRSYQTVILNGRVITNKTIQAAVEKAYEPFMMKRSYPLYVLNVNMPTEFLDVNVHPSKADVRFQDNHEVFSFIYSSIQRVLITYDSVKTVPQIEYVEDNNVDFSEQQLHKTEFKEESEDKTEFFSGYTNFFKRNFTAKESSEDIYGLIKNRMNAQKHSEGEVLQQSFDFETNEISADTFAFDGKIVGQAFDTYIIVEKGDNLYIIDQHAAHERILYDKLAAETSKFSQPLLIPYIYTANPAEFDFISNCLDDLNGLGFEISEFSTLTFKVSAVPDVLTDINFDKFFAFVTSDLIKNQIKTGDILKEKLMQTACKSAIKAGDSLNNEQIASLLKAFSEAESKPLQCPHGRPSVIKLPKTDLEKMFKRIV